MSAMKLSVCIPVYKVAPYIEQCARSLFEQTYDNIEYIFVDDHSPDDSIAILRRVLADYPQRSSQVMILSHDRNRGLIMARQTALAAVTGDLVTHCDSDDWLDRDLYASMVSAFVDDVDMAYCAFSCEYVSASRSIDLPPFDGSPAEFIDFAGVMPGFDNQWNKVFRREIALSPAIEWPESVGTSEDLCFVSQAVPLCRRIRHVPGPRYRYRQIPSSMNRTRDVARVFIDLTTTFDIVSRRVPAELSTAVRRHLADLILYYGIRSGALNRMSFDQWRVVLLETGGRYDFPWLNGWGRTYMRLAASSLPFARLFARIAGGRIGFS